VTNSNVTTQETTAIPAATITAAGSGSDFGGHGQLIGGKGRGTLATGKLEAVAKGLFAIVAN